MTVDELKSDFNKWESTLTYRQRKLSNMQCEEKYGCTVPELYDKLNAQLTTNEDLLNLKEDFEFKINDVAGDTIETLDQKIQKSMDIMEKDHDIIILIDDGKESLTPDEIGAIKALYLKFQSDINYSRRKMSNDYSLAIWGKSVTDMYKYLLSKAQISSDVISDADPVFTVEDTIIRDITLQQTVELYENSDPFHRELMKIDAYTSRESLYETAVLQNIVEGSTPEFSYESELPSITPFLTYSEYCSYFENCYTTPHCYTMIEDGKKYYNTIKALQEIHNSEAQLELGWNPAIPINPETIKVARDRQVKWMDENCRNIQIIDISNLDTQLEDAILEATDNTILDPKTMLKPIYIVLSFANTTFGKIITAFKGSEYSHAGISFDTSLDNIYTFNLQPTYNHNGFTKESIKEYQNKKGDVKLQVNTIFVPIAAWEKMKETLKYYEENKDKTRYGIRNIFDFVINKSRDTVNSLYMVCSQFVDNLLKIANIDITHKSSNLVAPGDFEKPKEGSKIFTIFKGWKKDYDKKQIDKKVKALEKANTFQQLNIMEATAIADHIFKNLIENFYTCDSENPNIHESLVKIRKMLTPTAGIVITEFKLPIRFTDNGSLDIDLPKNLQSEYEESHKLLSMYDESNMNGIKHEVARMFYLNGIIEKKLQRMKKTDKDFKTLMDLRARVLNDYTTYFKVIKHKEPEFDFVNYLKGTEYWNKSVTIDGATLKYSGAYIKKAIQLLK